jgi:hypothetical protein
MLGFEFEISPSGSCVECLVQPHGDTTLGDTGNFRKWAW